MHSCSQAKFCLSHWPLSGERGHYIHRQANLYFTLSGEGGHSASAHSGHFNQLYRALSGKGGHYEHFRQASLILHMPISDEGGHYVHSQATLSFTQTT